MIPMSLRKQRKSLHPHFHHLSNMAKNLEVDFPLIAKLEEKRISDFSSWRDDVWKFQQTTAGKRENSALINWCFDLPDGFKFTDPKWQTLLNEAKLFVWSYYTSNQRGLQPKLSAIGYLFFEFEYFIKWMVQEGYTSFADLTADVVSVFVDHLIEDKIEIANEAVSYTHLTLPTILRV